MENVHYEHRGHHSGLFSDLLAVLVFPGLVQ